MNSEFKQKLLESYGSKETQSMRDKIKKDQVDNGNKTIKKTIAFRALDGKIAQNLMILLGSMKKTAEEIKEHIIAMDEEHLSDENVQQLIKSMPASDQIKKLEQSRADFDKLHPAEQTMLTLLSINRLENRLQQWSFKMNFDSNIADLKPSIVAATAACEEIKKSQSFKKLLELILLTGNILNTGHEKGDAYAFEIADLNQIMKTKQANNSSATLLHFLVDVCDKSHPSILKFYEDLIHVDKAKTVAADHILKSITQMKKSIRDIENGLKTHKPCGDKDKFRDVMDNFVKSAKEKLDLLESMYNKMDRLYKDLGVFFCFDTKTFTLDEFFSEISSFKQDFIVTHKAILQERERKEKERIRKEEREKKEKEVKERNQRNINLTQDMNDRGLMDNILQGLQTGAVYKMNDNYTRRRAQQPRPGSQGRFLSFILFRLF